MTIPVDLNVTTCDTDSWADKADVAAGALGIVVSQYTFKFYLLPQQVRWALIFGTTSAAACM